MNLLMLGPPGSGKGTQAARLTSKFGMEHLSTGNVFRQIIKEKSSLGKKVQGYINQGELVPDDVVLEVVEEKMQGLSSGVVFDGFPRTKVQAQELDKKLQAQGKKLDAVILLKLSSEEIVRRLGGRRTCGGCGKLWQEGASRKPGVCDECGGVLEQREDDKEEVIRQRLKVYEAQTEPLCEYYESQGVLVEISGLGTEVEVFERITKGLKTGVDLNC